MGKEEANKEVGREVPGYTPELGSRLSEIIATLGSLKKAADIVDSSYEQVSKWRDGKAKMPLYAAAELCAAAGKSLDWLVWGEAGTRVDAQKPRFDHGLAHACIKDTLEELEEIGLLAFNKIELNDTDKTVSFTPEDVAEISMHAYSITLVREKAQIPEKSDGVRDLIRAIVA